LALQAAACDASRRTRSALGAQTEAMIGYVIEQELGNLLPADQPLATVLTMIEVDRDDPPSRTRPNRSVRSTIATAERLKAASGWIIAEDERVPASRPQPQAQTHLRAHAIRTDGPGHHRYLCGGGGSDDV
jgi:carbamate kinase